MQQFGIPVQDPVEQKADILALQLVSVNAGHHADPLPLSVSDDIFSDAEGLLHREGDADDIF